jgi:hypothetical protein
VLLRPKPWRQVGVWILALIIVGIWVLEIAAPSPAHLLAAILALVLIGGLIGYVLARVQLLVTPDAVTMCDVPASRGGSVPRAEVRSVHIYSYWVKLQAHSQSLLRIAPYWSQRQLTDLATELGVPLVTHKRQLGFGRDTQHGTVLYQPPGQAQQPGRAPRP